MQVTFCVMWQHTYFEVTSFIASTECPSFEKRLLTLCVESILNI